MAKSGRYPEPRRAVPMNFLRPSRTSKILTPGIVVVTFVILAAASTTGIIIAISIFNSSSPHKPGISVAQVFALIASSISAFYLISHIVAVLGSEPLGLVRPPEVRIHGYCFIVARLGLVAWTIALIASSVVASNPTVCSRRSRDCKLQILDVVCCGLAFLSTGILLTALEWCNDPFAIPEALHVPQMITCRVSSFDDDVFDESTRSLVQGDESVSEEIQHLSVMEQRPIARKLLPRKLPKRPRPTMPCQFPQGQVTISPPMAQNSTTRGWGAEWTHLVQDTSSSDMTRSYSSVSISKSSLSDTSTSGRSSSSSVSKRVSRPRNVTPSSSISNLSRRSPLSTMRSIEFPDVPIPAQLRYLPPVIAPPHEWNTSKTASLTQLLPVADAYSSRRRPSGTRTSLRMMKPIPGGPPQLALKFKRTTLDVKIPGAFIDYYPSLEDHIKLEEHARKIEQESIARNDVTQKSNAPVRLPRGEFEKRYTPTTLDSRNRYRQHKRIESSVAMTPSVVSFPDSAMFIDAVKVELVKPPRAAKPLNSKSRRRGKVKHFRRLTLGDIGPELGKLWDE